jgi:mgtE-like transporter
MKDTIVYSAKRIMRQSIPILVVALFISIGSGLMLESQEEKLLLLPYLALLIPPFINMGGDTASILGTRLSTAMHLGTVKPYKINKILMENVFATVILGVSAFAFLGVAAYGLAILINIEVALGSIFLISVVAGTMATLIMITIGVVSTFISYSHGVDPDNVVTPLMSTGGDIVGVMSLFITIKMMGI